MRAADEFLEREGILFNLLVLDFFNRAITGKALRRIKNLQQKTK